MTPTSSRVFAFLQHSRNNETLNRGFVVIPTSRHLPAAQNPLQHKKKKIAQGVISGSDMQYVQDSFDAGSVVAAWLSPATMGQLEPVLRRLMAGRQLFVKQPDGTYRPKGSELGLPRPFEFADLQGPALRSAGI